MRIVLNRHPFHAYSFAQTGLDFRRPTTDLDPGLVRLINLDKHSLEVWMMKT
jgi:hypothetical protein